jgi:Glycosyl hydrolase family 12/CARDB
VTRPPFSRSLVLPAALLAAGATLAVLPATTSEAATTRLCQSQTAPVDGGAYTVENNEWGSSALECVTTDGGADFTVANSAMLNATDGAPGGYPAIYKGCHYGDCTDASGFPVQVSDISRGKVTTSWSTVQPGGRSVYNVAYDVWFDQTPNSSQPNGTELMIWLNHRGHIQPYGSKVASNVSIGGRGYDVWFGKQAWNTVSYTMTSGTTSVNVMGLRPLIEDAVRRGYIKPSWYLVDVEAGFEIWRHGAGLATRKFSVHVASSPSAAPVSPSPSPAATPDISVQAISPNPPAPGASTNVTVDFKNNGSATASNLTLVTDILNSAGKVVGSHSQAGQNVAPGQTLNQTYTWTAPSSAGTYTIEGLVRNSSGKTIEQAKVGTVKVK